MQTKDGTSFDRRTVGRYIAKGSITQKLYDDHLKNLPDDEANGEWVKLDLVDAEISDDDMEDEETY